MTITIRELITSKWLNWEENEVQLWNANLTIIKKCTLKLEGDSFRNKRMDSRIQVHLLLSLKQH